MTEERTVAADGSTRLAVAGWILAALTAVFPPLALGAIGIGASLWWRKSGHGPAIVVATLFALVAFVYLASQTLIPRD